MRTQGKIEVAGGDTLWVDDAEANGGYRIAYFYGPDAEANAEYVKTCWNRHDDLVRLLSEMLFNHGPRNAEEARISREAQDLLRKIEAENKR